MKKLGSQITFSTVLFSKFTALVVLILCVLLAYSVFDRFMVEREMAGRRAAAEADYQALKERKESLLEKVEYLQGEGGIESEIRRNFDVAREGEQVVIIVEEDSGEEVKLIEGLNPSIEENSPWWQFWR